MYEQLKEINHKPGSFEFYTADSLWADPHTSEQMLSYHGKKQCDIDRENKSAAWKVMIAYYLKRHTAVTNGWLSHHLDMGVINGVSRYVAAFDYAKKHKQRAYERMIVRIQP